MRHAILHSAAALAVVAAAWNPGSRAPDAEVFDPAALAGLSRNRRIVVQRLQYSGDGSCDTGKALTDCLFFRDEFGKRYVLLKPGLEGALFVANRFYTLELQIQGFTPGGLPVAAAAGQTRLLAQKAAPYEGDIRESDPRAEGIKKSISAGQKAPEKIRVRYAGVRGDYLAFYDLEGRELLFRFREDRFDDRGIERAKHLIAGQAYEVSGRFTGVLLRNKLTPPGSADFARDVLDANSVLVFEYQDAFPLRIDQILF